MFPVCFLVSLDETIYSSPVSFDETINSLSGPMFPVFSVESRLKHKYRCPSLFSVAEADIILVCTGM